MDMSNARVTDGIFQTGRQEEHINVCIDQGKNGSMKEKKMGTGVVTCKC